MSERLVFGYGTSGHGGDGPRAAELRCFDPRPAGTTALAPDAAAPERRDWAFLGLMAFFALLFFRPQEQIPPLGVFHLAELAALVALGSMVAGRLKRGLTVTRLTPELIGVVGFGAVILATAPFSIWAGGAVGTFTELYVKIILIFVLMVNTLNSPKRIEQLTWLIVVASAYIALRAVADYARGVNLVENGRVKGAVGGMFGNPNDLALNMVAVLPLAASIALRPGTTFRRLFAAGSVMLMLAAVVASHSRSGSVGLVMMMLVLSAYLIRRRPGLVFGTALVIALALPLVPSSYWHRLSSITDGTRDETGSRETRRILLRESFEAFLVNPLTGVGAGQFRNYNPEGREQAWRESHDVVLQVAAELGILGVTIFLFLVVRGAAAARQTGRLLRRATGGAVGRGRAATPTLPVVTPQEAESLSAHSAAMAAALAGWFFCALFASVAYNWTFYYLLALAAAPREILLDRLLPRTARRAAAAPGVVTEARV
jgi:O-antigen ligase